MSNAVTSVRTLTADDADVYRTLRLQALADHPEAFGSSVEEERRFDASRWQQRLSGGPDLATFGAEQGGQLAGIATCARETHLKERHRASLVAMYVAPAARGTGAARLLVDAVISHARSLGLSYVDLDVSSNNAPAIALYRNAGFTAWGTKVDALRINGVAHDETAMVLPLEAKTVG